MVTITSVSKLQSTLIEEIESLDGTVTHTDDSWGWVDGKHRQTAWEVVAYFDDETHTHELEEALLERINDTGWQMAFHWDSSPSHDEHGVLFERHLR